MWWSHTPTAVGSDTTPYISALVSVNPLWRRGSGYGFLTPGDGSSNVLWHTTVVQSSRHDALPLRSTLVRKPAGGERHDDQVVHAA